MSGADIRFLVIPRNRVGLPAGTWIEKDSLVRALCDAGFKEAAALINLADSKGATISETHRTISAARV